MRLFAYGALSVVLALYLHEAGLTGAQIGLLFTLTLAGDAGISLWITTTADRIGRKKMLLLGAGLMILAGVVFSLTGDPVLLMIAAIIGVISPSGNEIGPFLSLEQAALSQLLPSEQRTKAFAWYNLAGSLATACGALAGGFLSQGLRHAGFSELASYKAVILGYAACGVVLFLFFLFLSPGVETEATVPARDRVLGLHKSKGVVMKLSALFALDAFAGGFVIQSMVAYWFHIKFGIDAGILGSIFFGANILAGVSALLAVRIASRIGLINTMVFTHIPSNVLLCLVPFMPNLGSGHYGAASPVQHLPDGRAHAPVLHHGRGGAGRALRCFGRHGHCPLCRSCDLAGSERSLSRLSGTPQRPLPCSRRAQDRL